MLFNWKSHKINTFVGCFKLQLCIFTLLLFRRLDTNDISGSIPSTVGNLTNLKTMCDHFIIDFYEFLVIVILIRQLHDNKLNGSIPASIGNLTNLYYLFDYTFIF